MSVSRLEWSDGAAPPVLTAVDGPPHWTAFAACQYVDPEIFFPEKGGSTRDAKNVCASCEVRAECLGYALEHNERFGLWGGLSEHERRRFKGQATAA